MATDGPPNGGAAARAVDLARAVASLTADRNVTFLAASVAYYAFVSLLPAAVLALVIAVTVGGERLAAAVIEASAGVLTETGQQVLVDALLGSAGQGSVTLISLPLTLWGALKVLRGLDIAFTQVYGGVETEGLLDQLRDALVVAASVGGGLVAMVVLGSVVAAVGVGPVAAVAGLLALPALLTVAFLPMYYVFPSVDVTLREALPGAVFAGVGWAVLQAAFQAYVEFQNARGGGQAALYGVLGAVLLLVTFLYFGATLVLVGAVINAVLAGRHRHEGGRAADPGARDVEDRQRKGTDARAE
nr:YihY/virulence factor BrkB family protein [Halobaculum sp. DT92]